jgi:hypothetical protein
VGAEGPTVAGRKTNSGGEARNGIVIGAVAAVLSLVLAAPALAGKEAAAGAAV